MVLGLKAVPEEIRNGLAISVYCRGVLVAGLLLDVRRHGMKRWDSLKLVVSEPSSCFEIERM